MKLLPSVLIIFFSVLMIYGDDEIGEEKSEPDDSNSNECENTNEEFGCVMPSACWTTCANMDDPIQCKAPCKPGCDCIPGFVRDEYGACINPKYCPNNNTCPPHQEIGCDSPCYPNTCENSYYNGLERKVCIHSCIKKCVCNNGWTFQCDKERICIPTEKCPICCPINREFKECGPFNPRSCDDPYAEEDICEENCNRGCFCKDGLVEDGYGNCIPPENCPLQCGPNEIEDPCANPCQPTCDDPDPPVCEFIHCNKRCVCRPPYIRDPVTNECVDKKDCIRHPCLRNEIYATSGFDCQKCSNYQVVRCDQIPAPQCICILDYVRDDDTGYCISPDDCPRS